MKRIYVLGFLELWEDGTKAALASNIKGKYIMNTVSVCSVKDITDIYSLIGEEVNIDVSLMKHFHEQNNGEEKYNTHVTKQLEELLRNN